MSTVRCVFEMALKPLAARERPVSRTGAAVARCVALAATVLLLAGAGPLLGAPISFKSVPPQPGQENFKHLWSITLHNPTPKTSSVSFRVEARDAKAGPVFSASTQPIAVAPGDLQLAAGDIQLTDLSCKKGYEAFTAPGKVLPEGDYTYVITLVPGMTQNAFFLRVRIPKPVELVWPSSGGVVDDTQPVFVWKPPVVSGPLVECNYALRIVEVRRGQNGATAASRNQPVFEGQRLLAPACRVPARTPFVVGRTYAWRVVVTDTAGSPVDTALTQSKAGTFVFKPGANRAETHTSFTFPGAGRSVTGYASLAVASDVPDAELCVMEYSLGSDSTSQDWHVIGSFPPAQGSFVGMWGSDSAVIRAGKTFPSPCLVRATVLGRKGKHGETAPLPLVINPPPPPDRRGCGCNNIPDE
jgi:hypothetical protein